ncbi:TyeA family type III secretion system gatekeeper subunit [Pandoraea pulmonicola]|uniref:SepL/TyeA/HrpJ family type III secretion system gatekeeper n=1 Tax=Pandoraea pulmonicola TaxID=93221 RepID=A0AAJ5D015_PANPU|nr:TyeA family type III secretion system gatekeeper subunit [Pandoraea pulmonicola]AJC21149.1 SepL/TyeA/HrpJ family type III secretion system gatekeeper [Pandoraea pulmonicola]SUA90184.1 type III secretion system protein SsaL [Pandoraea pulmonicola]
MVERLPASGTPTPSTPSGNVGATSRENAALERILDDEWQALEGDGMQAARGRARAASAPPGGHRALIEAAIAQNEEAAVAESQENLGFALGVRFRRGGEHSVRDDKDRARALFQQQMHRSARVSGVQFETLRRQLRDLPFVPDPLQLIRQARLCAGHAALIVAAWLADDALDPAARLRLHQALEVLTAGEEWAIEAFAALDCGNGQAPGAALLLQLKTLFRQARTAQRSLTQWFDECRRLPDRRARLHALLQALGLELGAQRADADVTRLAAVVDDLRRVVLFLTLESGCAQSAQAVHAAGWRSCDADTMIVEVLTLFDQPWVGVEWLTQRAAHLGISSTRARYAYAHALTWLVQSAHDGCFRDETQRETLCEALDQWRTGIAEEGEAAGA